MTLQSKLAAAARAKTRADERVPAKVRDKTDATKIAEKLVDSGVTAKALKGLVEQAEDAAEGSVPASEVLDPDTFDEFDGAVTRYRSLDGKIKALEAKKAAAKQIITEIIEATDHKTLLVDQYSVTRVAGARRESLDRKLLVEAGVTVEQLEKGTKVTTSAPYVQVKEIETPAPVQSEAQRTAPRLPAAQVKKVRK